MYNEVCHDVKVYFFLVSTPLPYKLTSCVRTLILNCSFQTGFGNNVKIKFDGCHSTVVNNVSVTNKTYCHVAVKCTALWMSHLLF